MKFSKILILILAVFTFSACKKHKLLTPKCENTQPNEAPSQTFRFTKLVLEDEFNGYNAAQAARDSVDEKPECYTQTPFCEQNLAWGTGAECSPGDYSHMAQLNKCRWSIYNGYNFWSKISNNTTAQVRTENGNVVFKSIVNLNVNSTNQDCGTRLGTHDEGTKCQYTSGGMNSKGRGAGSKFPGFATKQGRVEMRAKFPAVAGAYPAGWMWPGAAHPYPESASYEWIREIDIFEAPYQGASYPLYQTFHNWTTSSIARQFQLKTNPPLTEFVTYGVEFDSSLLRFYVNDCWVGSVRNGDAPQASWQTNEDVANFNGTRLKLDTDNSQAMFLIMSLGVDGTQSLPPSPSTYPSAGAEMWVDYVKVFH